MRHHLSASILAVSLSIAPAAPALPMVQQLEAQDRLQRDQVEIRRRADRLQGLMEDLLTRYEAQDRTQEVELLRKGLQHLAESGPPGAVSTKPAWLGLRRH